MIWVLFAACLLAIVPAGLKWLRVAQREHYLPGSALRFQGRWFKYSTQNRLLFVVGFAVLFTTAVYVWPGFIGAAVAALFPIGLSVRGRSSPLAWTPRLIRVALVSALITVALLVVSALLGWAAPMVLTVLMIPAMIDLSLLTLGPVERLLGNKWVHKAERKLKAVDPEVVAITGSYGKTTTKGYVTHLLSGSKRVVPTPASFNNRMGLARAINENLTPGTQVFVAEMGTYGKGEIADLCSWVTPKVAAIVSIGPVHLERFKTEERIVQAKSEILDRAGVGVICVDHQLLADLADARAATMNVIEVGTGSRGRVLVKDGEVSVDGVVIGPAVPGAYEVNLAVAVGIGLALGLKPEDMGARFEDLPRAEHRLTVSASPTGGFNIIDDTFNSNPQGARRALQSLMAMGDGRKVLVTPGMVELGKIQREENERFAMEASKVVDDIVIVGATNRAALQMGSSKGSAAVTVVRTREEAVDWVRANLGIGDTVLYENDLPDHYP